MQHPNYEFKCQNNAVCTEAILFEYGTGAGEISHDSPFGFLGHAECD